MSKFLPKTISFSRFSSFNKCETSYLVSYHSDLLDLSYDKKAVRASQYNACLGSGIQAVLDANFKAYLTNKDAFSTDVPEKILAELYHVLSFMTDDSEEDSVNIMFDDNIYIKSFQKYYLDSSEKALEGICLDIFKKVVALYHKNLEVVEHLLSLGEVLSEQEYVYHADQKHKAIVDYVCIGKEHNTVIDGKYYYNPQYIDKDQLPYYAYILGENGLPIKKAYFWCYYTAKLFPIKVDTRSTKEAFKKACKFADRVSKKDSILDFSRSPSYYCKYCAYVHTCSINEI